MGIKSTRILNRTDAIQVYIAFKERIAAEKAREKAWMKANHMNNEELGVALDRAAEKEAELLETTCFTNYLVSEYAD